MSSPFYYPYFSARSIAPPPLHDLDLIALHYARLQQEQQEIELAVRLKQEEINTARVRLYEEELRAKQNTTENSRYNSIEFKPNDMKKKQLIEQRERKLSQKHSNQVNKGDKPFSPSFKEKDQRKPTDKVEEQFQCQRAIQQYQQELLRKIQNTKQYRTLNRPQDLSSHSTKKNNKKKDQEIKKKSEDFEGGNIIINKKPRNLSSITFNNQKIKKQLDCHAKNQKYLKDNYHTIDVRDLRPKINQVFEKSHKKKKQSEFSVYKTERKKNKKERPNTSLHIYSTSKKYEMSPLTKDIDNRLSKNYNPQETALRRINNRLKLSSIVFKDSKLGHHKYHIDHLLNTFAMQIKNRKEMKDKINNNPKILQKHLLVVSSR